MKYTHKYTKLMLFLPVLLVSVFIFTGCSDGSSETDSSTSSAQNSAEETTSGDSEAASTGQLKEFDVKAKQWEFSPSTITVSKGDTVRLNIESADVTHGFSLPSFGISENLKAGQLTAVEFVADKEGTHTFACSVVCGSGHAGMNGTIVVQ